MNAITYYLILAWLSFEARMARVDEYLCRQRGDYASARQFRAHAFRCEEEISDLKFQRWLAKVPV